MKKRITRFIEDKYYTLLIHVRAFLERLHILHAPTSDDIQRDTEKMLADLDLLAR